MRLKARALLRSAWIKPTAASGIVVGLVIANTVAGALHRRGVVASDVHRDLHAHGLANVQVVMTVTPESYNTTFLQKYGSLAGIQGKTARLLGVTASGVGAIAAQYWVVSVRPSTS